MSNAFVRDQLGCFARVRKAEKKPMEPDPDNAGAGN